MRYGIMVHGGVTTPNDLNAGCVKAADEAEKILAGGGSALDAVVEAAVILEDDPIYNAGLGSRPRLSRECEMDAGLMTSDGKIGTVALLKRVQNPILVARKVMEETPHLMLAGEGAEEFARKMGFPDFDPVTERSMKRLDKAIEKIRAGKLPMLTRFLDYADGCDTIGAVALDTAGNFAASNSTGGTGFAFPGRVGDTPIPGAGFYTGAAGAVITTGLGEEIVRRMSAKEAYDRIVAGEDPQKICDEITAAYGEGFTFGILILTREHSAWANNLDMPVVVRTGE
jgi:isoaspartyl peptidase/L-asparaginase-like protein (Ntn-hydrolase superfamily)